MTIEEEIALNLKELQLELELEKSKNHASCPFCGYDFSTDDFYGINSCIDGFYFFCICGAQGPIAETAEEAVLLWNIRLIPISKITEDKS